MESLASRGQPSTAEPRRAPSGAGRQGHVGLGDRGRGHATGLLGACGPSSLPLLLCWASRCLHVGSNAPTSKSLRWVGPIPFGVTPHTPSTGSEHGQGFSPTPSLPVPDLSACRQDRPHWGHTVSGCTHHIWVHRRHSGSRPKPTSPRSCRLTMRALHEPVLGGAGVLGRAGSRPDRQSPRQGGGQALRCSGHCRLREEARRALLAPVPVSAGTCPLPQALCPHPVGPTGPPHHQLRPLPSGCGGAGTGRAMQPEGRVQGLWWGCRQKASVVMEHGLGQLGGPEALGRRFTGSEEDSASVSRGAVKMHTRA